MAFDPIKAEAFATRLAGTGAFVAVVAAGFAYGWQAAIVALGGVVFLFGLALLSRVPVPQAGSGGADQKL